MEKKNTVFCDIDGTIFKYRNFEDYQFTEVEPIQSTVEYLRKQHTEGHMVILTTARPHDMLDDTIRELNNHNIPFKRLIMGLERGPRYLINDIDPSKADMRAIAINLVRDEGFN